ncbi:OmpA family protein [Arenibacterium sp. LLYu02]|uniref:OmpA family protein n=1 Tax=Arenibacterium sp. LLYu02 TaxID=3404132 RepID=UPI003B21E5AF
MRRRGLIALLWLLAAPLAEAAALDVPLPEGHELLREQETPLATLLLPTGPAVDDAVPSRSLEGRIYRRSWRITGDFSALQVLAPIRAAWEAQGFKEVYACTARACGGFAFRFGIEVIPAPDMTVNLSDYEFLSVENSKTGVAASALVTRSAGSLYVQVMERHAPGAPLRPPVTPPVSPVEGETAPTAPDQLPTSLLAEAIEKGGQIATGAVGDLLTLQGHAPLLDLEFASGSTQMGEGPFDTLDQLGAFLTDHPSATILLVGHTDTVGSLATNVSLSERRAASVRERLISQYKIAGSRIEVAGAGFMAPLAPNTTEAGREINRRVEAVLVTP